MLVCLFDHTERSTNVYVVYLHVLLEPIKAFYIQTTNYSETRMLTFMEE
jgi:hypothetical protein